MTKTLMSFDPATSIELSCEHVCPNKIAVMQQLGFIPIMTRREGHYFWDSEDRRLFDVHINGGTHNLGHRNPEILDTLRSGIDLYDIGNHHFVSGPRAALADALCHSLRQPLQYTVFAASGGEAVDVALRSARWATGRQRILALCGGYHGHTGLSLLASDSRDAAFFHSDQGAQTFSHLPFNDIDAVRKELSKGDVAAVIVETIPATLGFPLPADGFLKNIRDACTEAGALYIADEVQTGLGRTGKLWAIEHYDVDPDILVTGKGLSGGMYPIAAVVLSEQAGGWLKENGWGHSSTFAGSELGCLVGLKALEIVTRDAVEANVRSTAIYLRAGLDAIQQRCPVLVEIRQQGFVLGLKFAHATGGLIMMALAREAGFWAFVAGYDRSVLQFKPDLLVDPAAVDELLHSVGRAIDQLQAMVGV